MKKAIRLFTIVIVVLFTISTLVACKPEEQHIEKDKYDVIYDLNYEGAQKKTVQVNANTRANQWRANRSGYTLEGWYTDKECSEDKEFDFLNYINADITLYAKWTKNAEKYIVTIDFNYEGAGENAKINVEEGKTISLGLLPECPRLGMVFEGFYKDSDLTQKWDLDTDVVTDSITLYAKYALDPTISRDDDGNVVFENIQVTVWNGINMGGSNDVIQKVVNEFNYKYNGQIKINLSTDLESIGQDNAALRIQQNPGANLGTNYYDVADLFDLIGVDYNTSDWYANEDSHVNGRLRSVPLYASVPYIIYNKTLMNKYNGTNALPSSYTEFKNLLTTAYYGESDTNSNFHSIFTNISWTYKEATSMAAFMQNGADYYVYEDGTYLNKWDSEMTNAKTALLNTYDLFNKNGVVGGSNGALSEYTDETAKSLVTNGDSLMALVNWHATNIEINDNIGVMPLSGLFADSDKAQYQYIPVHTVGMQFYKAKNVNITQLAAGAVFADYLTKNLLEIGNNGGYPLYKEIVQSDEFQNSENSKIKLLLECGNPENFHTLYGSVSGKTIINQTAAETYIVPFISETTRERLEYYISMLKESINGQLPT